MTHDGPQNETYEDLAAVKSFVLSKLAQKRTPELVGLETERAEVRAMLESVVADREGSSAIVMGPRAAGKTLLVNTVLKELESAYPGQFLVVRLSGFAASDDKMALREIAHQLDTVLYTDGADHETVEKKAMSETVQSLLDLFDVVDEPVGGPEGELVVSKSGRQSVVFVLDELDRFAQQSRQTLLYNLLEIAQNSPVGVGVVGMTTRLNLREMMEKRVRSRFSQLLVPVNRPATLPEFWQVCFAQLRGPKGSPHAAAWDDHVQALYASRGALFALVESVFYTSKDVRQFCSRCLYALARADPLPADKDFGELAQTQNVADTQTFVEGLSELETALLICAARAAVKLDADSLNFNLAYDEYLEVANSVRQERAAAMGDLAAAAASATGTTLAITGYRIWSKTMARSAWERLEALELIVPVDAKARKGADELRLVRVDVGLLELSRMIGDAHPLYRWTKI